MAKTTKRAIRGAREKAQGKVAARESQPSYGPEQPEGRDPFIPQAGDQDADPREILLDLLEDFRSVVSSLFGSFQTRELIASTELQRSSYKDVETKLKSHGKLLIVYNSNPSAVMFDVSHLEDLREDFESSLTVLERLVSGKGTYTAEQLIEALERNRPSE